MPQKKKQIRNSLKLEAKMSKELQIRDGNLIASFDLENEDGDIDFCKLLKVSHGVAEEIGMFVDYIATNKIIGDQSKEIADLEAKLAESERKNFELLTKLNLKEYAPAFCKLAGRDCEWLGKEKQLAISELEKVKEKAFHFYVNDTPELTSFYVDVKEIDNQIKSLKGEE